MNIELIITEDQLDKLLELTNDDEALQQVYWQLRGYWFIGEDAVGNEFISGN